MSRIAWIGLGVMGFRMAGTSQRQDLSASQIEAMDYPDGLCNREDLNLMMDLQLGDIQLLNNYVALHGRREYVDHEDEAEKRHMLRLWLTIPNGRDLPHWFEGMYGSIEPGQPRTGFPPPGAA